MPAPAVGSGPTARRRSPILPRRPPFDGPTAFGLILVVTLDEGADVHDPLALLAGDLGPVVGVGGVREVLVLLVLLVDRGDEVVGSDALRAAVDEPLDGQLLG